MRSSCSAIRPYSSSRSSVDFSLNGFEVACVKGRSLQDGAELLLATISRIAASAVGFCNDSKPSVYKQTSYWLVIHIKINSQSICVKRMVIAIVINVVVAVLPHNYRCCYNDQENNHNAPNINDIYLAMAVKVANQRVLTAIMLRHNQEISLYSSNNRYRHRRRSSL